MWENLSKNGISLRINKKSILKKNDIGGNRIGEKYQFSYFQPSISYTSCYLIHFFLFHMQRRIELNAVGSKFAATATARGIHIMKYFKTLSTKKSKSHHFFSFITYGKLLMAKIIGFFYLCSVYEGKKSRRKNANWVKI